MPFPNHLPHRFLAPASNQYEKWKIHQDIRKCFDHGIYHLARHPLKDNTSRPTPPFAPSLRVNHILLNNAPVNQMKIGWPKFLKGQISNEWVKLWTKSMGSQTAKSCESALVHALWDHTSYHLWIFRNSEDHKNDNRAVAQYKQQSLDSKISHQYNTFYTNKLPLNPLQQSHFCISQDQLLLLYYDIPRTWLRSADLHIIRSTARNDLARGSHAQHILHYTSGRPPDTLALTILVS
jgi:hypothetical protein